MQKTVAVRTQRREQRLHKVGLRVTYQWRGRDTVNHCPQRTSQGLIAECSHEYEEDPYVGAIPKLQMLPTVPFL